jgi:hypothetical protein
VLEIGGAELNTAQYKRLNQALVLQTHGTVLNIVQCKQLTSGACA